VVAWLRLPAVALLALGEGLEHPHPQKTAFLVTLALYSAWSAGVLAWTHLRRTGPRAAVATTAVDIGALSMLAVLSGGAFSHARLGFFIVPVTVAFRFRPSITAAATVLATGAYVIQAVAHPASAMADAPRFIATEAGFLLWVGVACVFLSLLLARRTEAVFRLAEGRSRLLADALSAEYRERRALAEALHDHAIQNLLSARHEVEEAGDAFVHPALGRADAALTDTVDQLRSAVFELHPYVLDEVGLAGALRSVAQHAASRGSLKLTLDLENADRHPQEQLLFSAVRELLTNVIEHAEATTVRVQLGEVGDELALVVEDDGHGFNPERLQSRLADGHVGLASQRVRIEAAGGSMNVASGPGRGTRVEIRVPNKH